MKEYGGTSAGLMTLNEEGGDADLGCDNYDGNRMERPLSAEISASGSLAAFAIMDTWTSTA